MAPLSTRLRQALKAEAKLPVEKQVDLLIRAGVVKPSRRAAAIARARRARAKPRTRKATTAA